MQIGIPKESVRGETRVAATPKTVKQLLKLGFDVVIQSGAGLKASFQDEQYEEAGAAIVKADKAWKSDIVFRVNPVTDAEVNKIPSGSTLVAFVQAAQNEALLQKLSERKITTLAMEMVPRISRAQSLDALSAMGNIAGYRAVMEAAHEYGSFFGGQITAAGKVNPAKVLVIGAGVAGLSAIAAAESLGAMVRAFDTRPEVKEQVESMGAQFLELDFEEETDSSDGYAKEMSKAFIKAEMELFEAQAKEVDIIITTALIPGKPAPKLIKKDMIAQMKPGSVIVDLAAANGGNCEGTQKGKVVTTDNDVTIIGYTDLPARLPTQSSELYGTTLVNLMKLLCKQKDGSINVDFEDKVIRHMTVTRGDEITFPPPKISVSAAPPPKQHAETTTEAGSNNQEKSSRKKLKMGLLALGLVLFGMIADSTPASFMSHFTVFVLACVVGYYVIWNVTHSLHTPLMSVTNAISGIIIVGALLQVGSGGVTTFLAFIAVLIASINIFGGFAVTHRMLNMFKKG